MKGLPKLNLRRLAPAGLVPHPGQAGTSLLGLSLEGSRLEGVWLRRNNGSAAIRQAFSASLSLDPLTGAPDLVGREIRKHLDAAEIRERRCAVCVPLNWALTLTTRLPELPEADVRSFLQIEAERGFPYDPDSLMIATSRLLVAGDARYATLVAIPKDHLSRLVTVLEAAKLRPVSLSLGIAALQSAVGDSAEGVLALNTGESGLSLQMSCGGGVALLRTIEGAFERGGGGRIFQVDHVVRELRITLGQLPPEMRDPVRESLQRVRIFGAAAEVEEIADQLQPRAAALGIQLEKVSRYPAEAFGVKLPPNAPVSPAMSLSARLLAGERAPLEFLPPRVSAWKHFTARYSSGKLVHAGAALGGLAMLVAAMFLVQQVQLWRWNAKWESMKQRVEELSGMQTDIRKYRPWFDESHRSLSILRRLTESFPEDGSVAAKTVEIRQPGMVTCTGTARDNDAWRKTLEKLLSTKGVSDVHVPETKGSRPLQFTFNFQWNPGGGP